MNTAERVKAIRSETGLSQVKFAERYGIPRRTLENWEGGQSILPAYVVALLERVVRADNEKA